MIAFDFEKWLEEHDGEDYCQYCIHDDECPHGVKCYGGQPIEPPCCSVDIKELLDKEALMEDLENEIMSSMTARERIEDEGYDKHN